MFKKLFFIIFTLIVSMGFALADVDVNTGDQAALDSIKGLGPSSSKAIIAERSKRGMFKDWPDFQARVKGIGEKSGIKLSEAGLTVNGHSKSALAAAIKPEESASDEVTKSK